jgi:hypothetical protein
MIGSVTETVFKLPGAKTAIVYKNDENQNSIQQSPQDDLVSRLQDRDAEVRAHEASHMNSSGVLTIGGPRFNYQIGPDGKAYAIGGEVTLSTLPAYNPADAEAAARNLKKAALGVSDPSPMDLAAASSAEAMATEARNAASAYKSIENLSSESEKQKNPIFENFA